MASSPMNLEAMAIHKKRHPRRSHRRLR